jgi:leader peptidase (prepilin peptidase)/N-methyltransferase
VRPRSWAFQVSPEEVPAGMYPWPVWGPVPPWLAEHRWALGLVTGLTGAAAGMILIRAAKFLFERGLGKEALGLGDADLMMMAGAFLGWQPVVLAVPAGAFVTLLVLPPLFLWLKVWGRPFPRHIPFGPGLAAGVVVCWLGWTGLFGELVRAVFFDAVMLSVGTAAMFGLLLVAGLLLRRT